MPRSDQFISPKMNCGRIYLGNFIHSLCLGEVEIIENGVCIVSPEGIIEYIGMEAPLNSSYETVRLDKDEIMIPGFVDTHTHAPQYQNAGVGMQYELLEWLDKVTFPRESSFFQNKDESKESYRQRIADHYSTMVSDYLANGTTTCCYFGSIQLEANKILASTCKTKGQRAFIGKVCMDCNSPDFYCETTKSAIEDTIKFATAVDEIDNGSGLVKSIVTPRFAITCSRQLMKELSKISKDLNLPIQSHLSENKGEISFVASLFPECSDYASVYDSVGLLTSSAIMAHSIYLSESEQELLKNRGTSISHCPNSNFALSSGIMPLRKYLQKGLKVGLGTDVSGGYSLSIFDAMRQAIIASKTIFFNDPSQKEISVKEAFHLATLGGAEALNLKNKIGNFAVGKSFDALCVKTTNMQQMLLEHRLEHLIFTGTKDNINAVYVNGQKVH